VGKSTLTEWVGLKDRGLLLDADAIARVMNPANPRSVAIAAGREILKRIEECLGRNESFAVETTLSSRNSFALIDEARVRGYEIHLTFVALDNPERCITRIRSRALRGGHFIPNADVRRRYERSIANLAEAVQAVDVAKVYDNSGDEHRLVLTVNAGVVTSRSEDLPSWVQVEGARSDCDGVVRAVS
jgi:predicted ABC-type ATPase